MPDSAALATQPPVERVMTYYSLVDAHDVDGVVGLFAPDAVYCRPGYEPISGSAGLTRFYTDERVIESGSHSVDTVVEQSGRVAVHGRFDGVLRDGSTAHLRFADFFVFNAEDQIARRDTFFFAPLV